MDPAYRIRRALAEHVDALPDVERAAARLFAGAGVTLDAGDVTPLAVLRTAQEQERLWVALRGAEVVGFALVLPSPDHPRLHLAELDVHPDHGRRGLGAALVEAVCDQARRAGLEAVTLTTFRGVAWNAPWYRRLGFREIEDTGLDDELRAFLRAEAEDGLDPQQRVAMRRTLAPPSEASLPDT
jgi:GNAT superfamily N-acetyltransferase